MVETYAKLKVFLSSSHNVAVEEGSLVMGWLPERRNIYDK